VIDRHGIDEIAFVGMKAFYGLNLYLDAHVGSVRFSEPNVEYSKYLSEDDLCAELAERENNLFALKASRTERFLDAVARCGELEPKEVGRFEADGNQLMLFVVRPRKLRE
jgi:hypothetical protein